VSFEVRWRGDWCEWLVQPEALCRMTHPTSSLPRFSFASLASCFAYSSSMFALEGTEGEPRSTVAQPTGGCGDGVPLFPKRSHFVNRPRSATHPSKHDIDAPICSSPEGVTEVE